MGAGKECVADMRERQKREREQGKERGGRGEGRGRQRDLEASLAPLDIDPSKPRQDIALSHALVGKLHRPLPARLGPRPRQRGANGAHECLLLRLLALLFLQRALRPALAVSRAR